jgi:protocatechuate 3,4-dioxygenase beta subunit
VTHLSGRILDARGNPVKNAVIEIWQVTTTGLSAHPRLQPREDRNFQASAASRPDPRASTVSAPSSGRVSRRTPHIHVKVKKGERELLTTQCYVKGEPQNARDGVLRGIRDRGRGSR